MLSKNNYHEKLRKMEPRKERFSIRKFSIGAASVLIGFSFMSMAGNQKVQAATEKNPVVVNNTKNNEHQSNDIQQNVKIDETNKAADAEKVNATTTSSQNATGSKVTQSPAQDSSKVNVTSDSKNASDSTNKVKQNNQATQPETSRPSTKVENNETVKNASASQNINKVSETQAKAGSESGTSTNKETVSENKAKVEFTNNIQPKAAMLSLAQESNSATQVETVADYSAFLNALRNANTGTINLQNDIDFSNANLKHGPNNGLSGTYERLNNTGIARAVTINGNGHELKMGDRYIEFTSANQENTDSNWDIQLKDLTLQTTSGYGPFWFANEPNEAAKNTITFNGVTTTTDSHEIMWYDAGGASTTHVKFEGNNTINSTLNGNTAAIYAYSIEAVNGNTTFNVIDSSPANAGANRSAILISIDAAHAGKVIVDKGATLTINGDNQVDVPEMNSADSYGTMGIRFQNWAKTDLDKAKTSVVQVNGNLNLNMGKGGSTAILGSYVDVQPDGNVTINTQQNGTSTAAGDLALGHRGTHFGVIAGGIETSDDYAGLRIANGGSLKIVRPTDVNSTQPLISYGDALFSGGKTFTVNVENGGTLDLQDGATDPQTWSFSNTSSKGKPNMPWAGLITMWGTSGTNTIKINNPKYINLQRTGNQTGSLMRLEGATNNVSINGDINNVITPLAQWDEGAKNNPSYYWYIENEANQNNWGDYANRFVQSGKNPKPAANAGATTFMHSSGSVQMAPNQAGTNSSKFSNGEVAQTLNEAINYQAPYLNQFLNHFSWWAPQRIAMGSGLEEVVKPTDAEKYQPVVQTIDGNTNQTLSDLTAKDGIKGLLSSDGTETTDLSSVKSVSWYDAATDSTEWNSVMGDEAKPTNPTGNLKTTDKSAWAKVTYTDGSVDFANIPLNITQPMAELYTPSYKPVSVEQGQRATDDPAFTDQAGKDTTAPTETTFTTGTDRPDWASIDPSTGKVTVNPSTDVTPGAYNIPVTVTYSDKSTDETTVPVIVTKAGQTVTWGDNGAVVTSVDTSNLNAHETTENSQVLSPDGVVTAEGYELTNGKISTTATPITIDPSTVSWTTTPNTNVETATAAGKEITASVTVDFTNNDAAKNILGSKNGVVTTNPFTIDAKGAGAKNITTPVTVALGSALTSEQFGQLVENNIPTKEIASTTWATKPDEQGQGGVIKITFNDKDANGNPTYLNINIPASSITVTTDAETNTPQGQDVSTKVGETPDAENGIKNLKSLPKGTTYTWQNTPDTTKPGKKPAVIVVTYPDGSKDEVPTNVVVNANPEIKTITTTVGGNPAATEGIANLNNRGTTPVDGYPTSATWTTKPDTSKPGATTGTATVTYPDGTTETVTIPVAVNGQGDVTIIDKGHVFSLHANNVVTHKTSDKNIIGEPVIENFKLSYYQGGQNYSKPYIYTLNADKTLYVLTQTGDNPAGVTVNAPKTINASDIKISWTEAGKVLFNNALGAIEGNGRPTSLVPENSVETQTITYTNWVNNQQNGYPKYSAVVNSSGVNWPIYGKGPVSTYPFPSVYIYGAEANGTIPSVNSDVSDLKTAKTALGDASNVVNTKDLTADHNSEISSVNWQTLPSLAEANPKAPATVRINFTDGSYLDVPVAVNVIKVDQGVDDKTNHEIYRDITRTINVEGESTPVIQHVIYSRAKITDLSKPAGQQYSYTAWAPAKNSEGQAITNFPQYEVTKPGYTATATDGTGANVQLESKDGQQYVPASGTITENSSNEVVNVTYTANEHTLVINYVDGDGTVVGTYNVPGKTNETVNVDVPGHVPTNWKLVPKQQIIGSYKFGSNDPQPIEYKVEHGTKDITPNDPSVNPSDPKYKDMFTTVSRDIYQTKPGETKTKIDTQHVDFGRNGVEDLVTGVVTGTGDWKVGKIKNNKFVEGGKAEFASENAPQIKGYDSYVDDVKSTEVPVASALKDGQPVNGAAVNVTYVKQAATPKPYTPGQEGVNDDMNQYVTRTIVVHEPGQDPVSHDQTVHFTREDAQGNAGYTDPATGITTWNAWHVAGELNQANGTWAEFNAPTVKGYTASQAKVAAEEVTAETKNVTVDINYAPVAPTGKNVTTKVGEVPDADQGIANKNDLPDGTKYSWKTTPDVSTEGNKPAVVVVTYPGGSTVEVPVTVTVTKNPTDADKYTPEGQDVNTKTGVVPNPAEGIKNKSDLPDGTKYTWKDTPDVSTAGDKPATVVVSYPDGSKDEVPVTIHVTNPATDAD
ncbi:Rib/alpha-like domain-containing protein, partial [Lactobacillus johnsonii]|uniref:Rib/alpha-like domain-containing protein n=1 Tax=Lactobacillus johnsonii TaxID=33959 RepID=UPI0021A85BD9